MNKKQSYMGQLHDMMVYSLEEDAEKTGIYQPYGLDVHISWKTKKDYSYRKAFRPYV